MNHLLKKPLPGFVQRIKFFENCFIPRDTIFTRFLPVTLLILLVSLQIISAQDCAQISTQSDNISVCAGSAAAFSVKASGTGLTYQWQVSTGEGNTFQPITSANINQQYKDWSTPDISLTNASASLNGYRYRCVINSSCNKEVTSRPVTLKVNTKAPDMPARISGSGTPCTDTIGLVYSTSPDTNADYYTWTVPQDWKITNGQGTASVTTTSGLNNGSISVVAINSCGTSNARTLSLKVGKLPDISIQPEDNLVTSGSAVTFKVTATGGAKYQWRKNGLPVADAHSPSYTVARASEGDVGMYDLVVTDANGCNAVTRQAILQLKRTNNLKSALTSGGQMSLSPLSVNTLQAPSLTDGLVAFYNYNNNINDYSGNNNNATYYGRKAYSPGRKMDASGAANLNGSTDYIVESNTSWLNPTVGITVSAWVKPTVNFEGSGNDAIVDKGFTSHSAPYYQYHLGICGTYCGSGGHYFSFCCAVNGVGYGKYTHPLQWVINNWYHVVGTYDGTYMRIYINGTCNDSMAVSGSLSTYNTDVFNGKFRNVNYFSPIDVDEIRIYNRALTKTEINMLYKDLPNAPSNLSASAVSGSRINLSWTDNSANEDGFKIERKTGTGSYTEIGTVGPNISTFACQNLQPCSDNTYRIRAYNSGGNSEYSNDANARTYCNYIKLNTSGITSGYTYTVSGEGIPITSFATGQVDSVPLVSSSENAEFFIHVNGGSMNEALDLKFIAGSSQGIRNVQVLKNGAYVPFKQDYFEIPQKLALVFMPWKNNNSQNSLIHLVLKDGILLTPTMQGSFNLLQITGLEQITNFSIKIFSLTGLLVFDNTNKTSFWDGKDMTTNVLVLKGIYKYIIQADSHSLSGELMVDY